MAKLTRLCWRKWTNATEFLAKWGLFQQLWESWAHIEWWENLELFYVLFIPFFVAKPCAAAFAERSFPPLRWFPYNESNIWILYFPSFKNESIWSLLVRSCGSRNYIDKTELRIKLRIDFLKHKQQLKITFLIGNYNINRYWPKTIF